MKAAFYKGNHRLFNKLTAWWDNGIYTHMELVFSDQVAASSSFSDGGVRFKSIKFDGSRWDFIELPERLFCERDARVWFDVNKGRKYDFSGLIRFVADALPENRTKFFCSEACLSALNIKEAWRFTPNSAYILLNSIIEAENVRASD